MTTAPKHHYDSEDLPQTPQAAIAFYEDAKRGIADTHDRVDNYVSVTLQRLIGAINFSQALEKNYQPTPDDLKLLTDILVSSQVALANVFDMVGRYRSVDKNVSEMLKTLLDSHDKTKLKLQRLLKKIERGEAHDPIFQAIRDTVQEETASDYNEVLLDQLETFVDHTKGSSSFEDFTPRWVGERIHDLLTNEYSPSWREVKAFRSLYAAIIDTELAENAASFEDEEEPETEE